MAYYNGKKVFAVAEVVQTEGGSVDVDTELDETSSNPVENKAIAKAINSKQDKLEAGTNITIEGNVISATGGGGVGVTVTFED